MKELLFFSKGETCEPCVEAQEYLDENDIKGYTKINPFEEIELAIEYEIKLTPTLALIEDGKILKKVIGAPSKNIKRYEHLKELYINGI